MNGSFKNVVRGLSRARNALKGQGHGSFGEKAYKPGCVLCSATEMIEQSLIYITEEIESRLTPSATGQDEALSARKLATGIVDSFIGAFKKYCPCRPDERVALVDAIEAAVDQHDAALRSRQPSASASRLIPAARTADLLGLKIYTDESVPDGVIFISKKTLHEALAARPSSPQGEGDDQDTAWNACRAERTPPAWTVAESFNYHEFFNLGWEARARLAASAKDAQSVAELLLARGYLASADDIGRVAKVLAEVMPGSAKDARAALERKEGQ